MSKKKHKTNLKKADSRPVSGSAPRSAKQPASQSASQPASQAASRSAARAASRPASKPASKTLYWILGGLALLAVIVTAGVLVLQNGRGLNTAAAATLPKEISVQEAYAKRQDGAFILDVRQPEEWVDVHVPGSTLIPLGELDSRLSELPKDKEIVVLCRSGNRSQEGRDILTNAGFTQVTSVSGGINDWQSSGYETVTGP